MTQDKSKTTEIENIEIPVTPNKEKAVKQRLTAYELRNLMPFTDPILDEIENLLKDAAINKNVFELKFDLSAHGLKRYDTLSEAIFKDLKQRGFACTLSNNDKILTISWKF